MVDAVGFAIGVSVSGARANNQDVGQRERAGSAKKRGGGPVKIVALEEGATQACSRHS
jgi:hypothetical protein